jgi:hypothetical protein
VDRAIQHYRRSLEQHLTIHTSRSHAHLPVPLLLKCSTLTGDRGSNLPPSSNSYDDAPRSAMRIINSLSTQTAFRAKGGRTSEDTGERRKRTNAESGVSGQGGKEKPSKPGKDASSATTMAKPKIMPHESLAEFNRRVEASLRGGVTQAIKSANAKKTAFENAKKKEKEERKRAAAGGDQTEEDKASTTTTTTTTTTPRGKRKHDVTDDALEFASAPGPRRLNDIAQAPPALPQLRVSGDKETKSAWTAKGKGKSGLSAGQERLMEQERERVIKRYREMKAAKEEVKDKERQAAEAKKLGKKPRIETAREYQSDSE